MSRGAFIQQMQPTFSSYTYLLAPKEKAKINCISVITGCNISAYFLGVILKMIDPLCLISFLFTTLHLLDCFYAEGLFRVW